MEWTFLEKVVCLGNAELASHLDNEGLSFNSLVITRFRDVIHEGPSGRWRGSKTIEQGDFHDVK
jgi:hypothetical protein